MVLIVDVASWCRLLLIVEGLSVVGRCVLLVNCLLIVAVVVVVVVVVVVDC